jgi:hypothetical protein
MLSWWGVLADLIAGKIPNSLAAGALLATQPQFSNLVITTANFAANS